MASKNHIELIEELVQDALGDEAVAHDEHDKLHHPQAVAFYADEPDPDFDGFGGRVLFEANFVMDEMDDNHKHHVERADGVLFYVNFHSDGGGTYSAAGQALVCEPGSAQEQEFLQNVMEDMAVEAAGPLSCALSAFKGAKLELSPKAKERLSAETQAAGGLLACPSIHRTA